MVDITSQHHSQQKTSVTLGKQLIYLISQMMSEIPFGLSRYRCKVR